MSVVEQLPVVQGFHWAHSRAEPVCPYTSLADYESFKEWWMGYAEGVACFGPGIKDVVVPRGHDHPEWV